MALHNLSKDDLRVLDLEGKSKEEIESLIDKHVVETIQKDLCDDNVIVSENMDTTLQDLGMDSLDLISMLIDLEQLFGIDVDDQRDIGGKEQAFQWTPKQGDRINKRNLL